MQVKAHATDRRTHHRPAASHRFHQFDVGAGGDGQRNRGNAAFPIGRPDILDEALDPDARIRREKSLLPRIPRRHFMMRAGNHVEPDVRKALPDFRHDPVAQRLIGQQIGQMPERPEEQHRPLLRLAPDRLETAEVHPVRDHMSRLTRSAVFECNSPVMIGHRPDHAGTLQRGPLERVPQLVLPLLRGVRPGFRQLLMQCEGQVVFHQNHRHAAGVARVFRHLGVFQLHGIHGSGKTEVGHQFGHRAVPILGDLPRYRLVGVFLIDIHHADVAENLVQFVIVNLITGLAETEQDEIDSRRHRAAKIVHADRAAMGQRKGQIGRHDDHPGQPAKLFPVSRRMRDIAAYAPWMRGGESPQRRREEQPRHQFGVLQFHGGFLRERPALPRHQALQTAGRCFPVQRQKSAAERHGGGHAQLLQQIAAHHQQRGPRSHHLRDFPLLQLPERVLRNHRPAPARPGNLRSRYESAGFARQFDQRRWVRFFAQSPEDDKISFGIEGRRGDFGAHPGAAGNQNLPVPDATGFHRTRGSRISRR